MEEWKPIIGYEWLYEISNLGRVKSLNYNKTRKWKIMKLKKERIYSRIWLSNNSSLKYYTAHRLVAIHFIPNPENKFCACHKDEKLDENGLLYNWADNLYWGTHSENSQDRENKWRWSKNFILNNPSKWKFWKDSLVSKKVIQYSFNREFIREFESITEASKILWISSSNITVCCDKEWKTAWWFRWKSK